jgi:NADH:ubiquinone oxidoreductase subunit E
MICENSAERCPVINMTSNQKQTIEDIIDRHIGMKGALLPLLYTIREKIGFIPSEAVGDLAKSHDLAVQAFGYFCELVDSSASPARCS